MRTDEAPRAVAVRRPDRPGTGTRLVDDELDIRLRYPVLRVVAVALVVGAFGAILIAKVVIDETFSGTVQLMGLKLDAPSASLGVEIVDRRLQSITSLARSEPFRAELIRRSGLTDLSQDELESMISAFRPSLTAIIQIKVEGDDPEMVRLLSAQLVPSLDRMVELARDGALITLDEESRDPSVERSFDYRGPLYLDIFQGRPSFSSRSPGTFSFGIAGAGLAGFVLIGAVLMSHRTVRCSFRGVGATTFGLRGPLRVRHGGRRGGPNMARAAAEVLVDAGGGQRPIVLGGNGIRRERACLTLGLAAAIQLISDRPVLVVDLDLEHATLTGMVGLARRWPRRRSSAGVIDVLADHRAPDLLVQRRKRRQLPALARRLLPRSGSGVLVLGAGSSVRRGEVVDTEAVGELIDHLAASHQLVVHLPEIPGPWAAGPILERAGSTGLVVLDGWSDFAAAVDASAMLRAVPAPSFVLVLENG